MSTPDNTPNDSESAAPGCELHLVAVVIDATLFGGCNNLCRDIFDGALRHGLEQAGVNFQNLATLHRKHFLVSVISCQEIVGRNRALEIIDALLTGMRMRSFFQVGFFDRAEMVWRTVSPKAGQPPIERFLVLSEILAAMLEYQQATEANEKLLKDLEEAIAKAKEGQTSE